MCLDEKRLIVVFCRACRFHFIEHTGNWQMVATRLGFNIHPNISESFIHTQTHNREARLLQLQLISLLLAMQYQWLAKPEHASCAARQYKFKMKHKTGVPLHFLDCYCNCCTVAFCQLIGLQRNKARQFTMRHWLRIKNRWPHIVTLLLNWKMYRLCTALSRMSRFTNDGAVRLWQVAESVVLDQPSTSVIQRLAGK